MGSMRYPGSLVPAAALDQVEALLRQKDGELGTCIARIVSARRLSNTSRMWWGLQSEPCAMPSISLY